VNIPTWTKPSLLGVGVGAISLAIIGFNWGGWVTSSTATEISDTQSSLAVASALTPYCVQKAENDPKSIDKMAELSEATSYQRRRILEDTGWATPLGADKPNRALAEACEDALNPKT